LPTLVGTIRTAVGFAFYSGVKHINLVGCDGLQKEDSLQRFGHQYDKRLHKYISSKSYGSHWKHRARAEVMMKNCGITYEFVGTP
jgi:hypothetical protein